MQCVKQEWLILYSLDTSKKVHYNFIDLFKAIWDVYTKEYSTCENCPGFDEDELRLNKGDCKVYLFLKLFFIPCIHACVL